MTPSPCLFERLPVELRLTIYELVFACPNTNTRSFGTDLCKATPPSKALLSTCRRLHFDAKATYHAAHRHYWRTTPFVVLRFEDDVPSSTALRALRDEDLAHLTNLKLIRRDHRENPDLVVYELADHRGGWIVTGCSGIEYRQLVSVTHSYLSPPNRFLAHVVCHRSEEELRTALDREGGRMQGPVSLKAQIAFLLDAYD